MVGEGLGGGVFAGRELPQRRFERLAVRVGRLVFQRGGRHLGSLGIREGEQAVELFLRGVVGHGELVVGPILVELGLPQLQLPGGQVFAKLGPLGDVAKPLEQISPQREPLSGVGLLEQHVDVELGPVGRFGVGGHRPHLLEKRLHERRVEIGPPGVGEGRIEFSRPLLVAARVLLVDPCRGGPGFERPELALIFLPRPIVVGSQHGDGGRKQQHGCHAKHDVQRFEIPPGLFGSRHVSKIE